jgi:hypothetical protein
LTEAIDAFSVNISANDFLTSIELKSLIQDIREASVRLRLCLALALCLIACVVLYRMLFMAFKSFTRLWSESRWNCET